LSESLVATDITEPMLDRTRERIKGLSAVTVQREDCGRTTFLPATFDTTFLGLTFLLVDGLRTVAEMQRLLKPGGRLILAIPTIEGLRLSDKVRCIMRNYRTYGTIKPPGTKLYTHRSLPPLITQGGVKVLDVEQLTDPAHPGGFSGLYVRAVKI
jgi:SAM-dependent methyltransferase